MSKRQIVWEKKEVSGLFIRSDKLYQIYISCLSIIFGGTVQILAMKDRSN